MIVCDDVVEDKRTIEKTIFNAFNQIWAKAYPAKHQRLVVFLSLANGRGEVTFFSFLRPVPKNRCAASREP
jgi:hypothetical protein